MKEYPDPREMFYGEIPSTFRKAELLRKKTTKAERVLWSLLRKKQLGVRFKQQHPIAQFIVDFYCHKHKLVIKLDGGYHLPTEQKQKDEERQNRLEHYDISVIRFTNEELLLGPE